MKTKTTIPKSGPTLYTSLDLHSRTSVLGVMNEAGEMLSTTRFDTRASNLKQAISELPDDHRIELTVEAAPMARWAHGVLVDLVDRLVICDPRSNRLISQSAIKNDEADVIALCRLLRMGELHEVWMSENETRTVFHDQVFDLLKLRNQQRQLKTLIKTRFQAFGVLRLDGKEVFHPEKRQRWIDELPPHRRNSTEQLYLLLDTTLGAWRDQMREVNRSGKAFPEIARFQEVPGVAEVGAAVFSAFVQDPNRFASGSQLCRYAALGITSRSSDGKPLGYERLDRRGQRELKNMSYHAWRTGIRRGHQCDVLRRFYDASTIRTGSKRHARLNTQRKVIKTLWSMWKNDSPFDPDTFLQTPEPELALELKPRRRRRRRRSRSHRGTQI